VALPREALSVAGLERGDEVLVVADPAAGAMTIRRADDTYTRAMRAGRAFAQRYRRTMAALAR